MQRLALLPDGGFFANCCLISED